MLNDVWQPMRANLQHIAPVLGSNEYQRLRHLEREYRENRNYTTGQIGCIDGRIYTACFALPLNLSSFRTPAGRLEINKFGQIADRPLMSQINHKLRQIDDLHLVEFFQTHASFYPLDQTRYYGCGAVRASLGNKFQDHADQGVAHELTQKQPAIAQFVNELGGIDRVTAVQTIFDTDSLGEIIDADEYLKKHPSTIFTRGVIISLHNKGQIIFTPLLRHESEIEKYFSDADNLSRGRESKFYQPENFYAFFARMYNYTRIDLPKSVKDLNQRLTQIYGNPETKADTIRLHALYERILWNICFRELTGWDQEENHPLRTHREKYILHGPKGDTFNLNLLPFTAHSIDGVIATASLFPPNQPIPYLMTEIAKRGGTDEAARQIGVMERRFVEFFSSVLNRLSELLRVDNRAEMQKLFDIFLDKDAQLRFIPLPPLLLQQDTRKILYEDWEIVASILPSFYDSLIEYAAS